MNRSVKIEKNTCWERHVENCTSLKVFQNRRKVFLIAKAFYNADGFTAKTGRTRHGETDIVGLKWDSSRNGYQKRNKCTSNRDFNVEQMPKILSLIYKLRLQRRLICKRQKSLMTFNISFTNDDSLLWNIVKCRYKLCLLVWIHLYFMLKGISWKKKVSLRK